MRITIVGINYAPERTGIAPYTTAVAKHFAREHDVTVLTGVPHYPEWSVPPNFRKWRSDTDEDGVRVVRLGHHVPNSPGVAGRAAYELTFATRAIAAGVRIPADVVIAVVPPLFGAHAARLIARRHRAPYGVIVQDIMSAARSRAVCGARRGSPGPRRRSRPPHCGRPRRWSPSIHGWLKSCSACPAPSPP